MQMIFDNYCCYNRVATYDLCRLHTCYVVFDIYFPFQIVWGTYSYRKQTQMVFAEFRASPRNLEAAKSCLKSYFFLLKPGTFLSPEIEVSQIASASPFGKIDVYFFRLKDDSPNGVFQPTTP